MKTILFAFLFLLIPNLCISQLSENDDAVYLDSLFNIGTAKNYRYLRIIKDYKIPNKESYQVGDYYKSGKIAMKGTTTTRNKITKTGTFFYFYENGSRKSIINYENNTPIGSYFEFYENGSKKLEGEWCDNKNYIIPNVKIKNCWNEMGVQTITEGTGFFEEVYFEGSIQFYYTTVSHDNSKTISKYDARKKELEKGKIVNNLKDSIWTGYDKKTKIRYFENFKKGEFISGVSVDSNKVEYKYNVREIRPLPKKGMQDFYEYISRNFNTPKVEGLEGKVILSFVVDVDGTLTDFKILRDLGFGTGEEAIRVVKNYNGWIPGEQRGIKLGCVFGLPISVQSNR